MVTDRELQEMIIDDIDKAGSLVCEALSTLNTQYARGNTLSDKMNQELSDNFERLKKLMNRLEKTIYQIE